MLSQEEKNEILRLFGLDIEKSDPEEFEKSHKAARLKYHPDKFEKHDDEVVREMAKEKFQRIEELAGKAKAWLTAGKASKKAFKEESLFAADARFAFEDMKVEIITRDKDLKYKLFGTQYRWLERGDRYKIPGTTATIIIDNNHRGRGVGFVETVRMYLTFQQTDSPEEITQWLLNRIEGNSESLIIEGNKIPVEYGQMLNVIKRSSFLRIGG